jgi:hypothetical protein
MRRKQFKLRSGNTTPFKQMGEKEETPEQYNARIRAEHEAKMQAYEDSTASYSNQIKIDKLLGEAYDVYTMPLGTGDPGEYYEKSSLAEDLHFQNVERGVYPVDRPGSTPTSTIGGLAISSSVPGYNAVRNENDSGYITTGSKHPEDLRPTKPREPMEKIDRIKIKNIDMLPTTTTVPDIIEPTKRKYITSKDGKWKTNLETGEKTRVKTQKVKKSKKPGKRSVRNLVTGGTNKVQ